MAAVVASLDQIERHEFKYLLAERLVPAVRSAALSTCTLDSHAQVKQSYLIRSLYFDTDQYHLYWACEREQRDRFKVRVRTYPGRNAVVFLEIKRRVADVVLKTRVALPAAAWQQALRHPSGKTGVDNRVGDMGKALTLIHTYHLRPVMLVEYEREAYVSSVDSYARLTFDRKIVCQVKETMNLDADEARWRPVDHRVTTLTEEPVCVLELKFGRTAPRWMVQLVRRLDLVRQSFSKYCSSIVEQLSLPSARIPLVRGFKE